MSSILEPGVCTPDWFTVALSHCMCADQPALVQAFGALAGQPRSADDLPPPLRMRLAQSQERCARRAAALPRPDFPEDLPISARRGEIARAISQHQVVIVCGETGSGKTTQLPKICLELGRGSGGLIGHTQPRRIAARATATRIAHELASELGRIVGYKIRFSDRTSAESYIKLMTDGILLAETQGDAELRQYDTIIIDEAHERSLNIDFLLGYLRQLLARRPELKLIVTSATLDAERFARHFASVGVAPPVIEVSGRLYPIEVRYRPLQETSEERGRDMVDAIVDAVDETHRSGPGDVLVFLPGEREIRETAEGLRKHHFGAPGIRGQTEILPLFARQSAQEQSRVFQSHPGRRIVLATNVAETSLTVPGIRFVVDSGLARIKRYSHRNKVEQLRVEPVSQSAAKQRAGRCGRVASGVCIRLYDEQDFERRPAHTDPEILRSSLAGVILRMKSLALGAVEDFPFLDRPQPRMIADGYQLLGELGAVDEARELTAIGRELAKLPLDPRIGRMILASRDVDALREVMIVAAALSVQDPRDRPAEQAAAADQAHAKWKDERSEFLAFLKLWDAADEVWRHQSSGKQRAWCKSHFLSYMRMREWRDVHGQLHSLCTEHGWRENTLPASYEAIHRALLAGLLGNIGLKSEGEAHYLGARGIKFFPHPGSALAKKAGRWIVCAELVETTRLFGRCLARVEPQWLEQVGAHLVKRHVVEPHWSKKAGQVVAYESATLHGLPIYARRLVTYTRLDRARSRAIFIREALVNGELAEHVARGAAFFQHNRKLVADIEALEHKTRRPDVLVDEELIFAFYDAAIPAEVADVRGFEHWRREAERSQPKLLYLEREQLMRHEAAGVTSLRFPAEFDVHGQRLPLSYRHQPGTADDGVTLAVPLAMLNQVPAQRCEWLVPGLLEEKVKQLVRTLPQKIRHRLVSVADYAAEFGAREHDTSEPLLRALQRDIEARVQLKLPLESFRGENLPDHLLMNFRVIDEHGRMLAQSRNLAELRSRLAQHVQQEFAQAGAPAAQHAGYTSWSFGELPESIEVSAGGHTTLGFPALVDDESSVSVCVFDTRERAQEMHRAGLRRLFALALKEQLRYLEKSLPAWRDLALAFMPFGGEAELRAQIVAATLERTCMAQPWPNGEAAFALRKEEARPRIALVAQEIARLLSGILADHAALQKKLAQFKAFPAVVEDIKAQWSRLLPKGFVAAIAFDQLRHYPRYLKAASLRLDKLRADPGRDERLTRDFAQVARPFEREHAARIKSAVADPQIETFRWLLEELRVQLFAQELKTPAPVSVKRLQKIWQSRQR